MNKRLPILIVFAVLSFSLLFMHHHDQPYYVEGEIQESHILTTDLSPSPDHHDQKAVRLGFILLWVLAVMSGSYFVPDMVEHIRRLIFLSPVFYQSNNFILPFEFASFLYNSKGGNNNVIFSNDYDRYVFINRFISSFLPRNRDLSCFSRCL
ncbi:hypothetical protein [Halobacillus litoralis]|uniref:hypothetical protein n=1 Tax=Halobacillus litoralis TaxID=45668 RepID=UPI001CFEB82B|nr:hypothetical protein [Halobacillus litoralis]